MKSIIKQIKSEISEFLETPENPEAVVMESMEN